MFQAIENNHDVTSEHIRVARGQRPRTFDLAVGLLFLPLYSLGAATACRWLSRRFSSNERYVRLVATGLASIAAAFLGLQCFRLWGAVWEVIRVGNGHMSSIRAASYGRWSQQYVGADFIGGIVLFWLIALICYRVVSDDQHSTDAHCDVSGTAIKATAANDEAIGEYMVTSKRPTGDQPSEAGPTCLHRDEIHFMDGSVS